jgi:hypothetical protein
MTNLQRLLLISILSLVFAGCGTLQVGIEGATRVPVPAPTATNTPRPTATQVVATPTLTISVAPSPTLTAERINFPIHATNFTFSTHLNAGVPDRYVLQVLAQQTMTLTTSRNVTIQVFDAQGNPVKATTSSAGQWQGTIPQTGDYIIVLRGQGFINVSIDIPPPG